VADYLEEAAAELRKARAANEREAGDRFTGSVVREERMRIAEAFTRLAAIEKGLLPPEMIPDEERAAC
jgi:hypothetical protein